MGTEITDRNVSQGKRDNHHLNGIIDGEVVVEKNAISSMRIECRIDIYLDFTCNI